MILGICIFIGFFIEIIFKFKVLFVYEIIWYINVFFFELVGLLNNSNFCFLFMRCLKLLNL